MLPEQTPKLAAASFPGIEAAKRRLQKTLN
jgi:hypothetical protein